MPLSTDLFDYQLPPHLIAQTPAMRRDASRLLVVDRSTHTFSHHVFSDLPNFLRPTDTLFRNNAAVLPARLRAQRPTGGAVECFLLRPDTAHNTWWCLVRPGKKLPVGSTFFHDADFTGTVLAKDPEGAALIRFSTPADEPITAITNRLGEIPLPPYINRDATHTSPEIRKTDHERYQTVYAAHDRQVAVAAPTAGLHFTKELLEKITAAGTRVEDITLHVGLGTFKPIATQNIEEHPIHRELYEIPPATQRALVNPRGRRIAVGTTSVRTIEDFFKKRVNIAAGAGVSNDTDKIFASEAAIYIYPSATFAGVDAMITNFHQPRSTLLCLVSAFLTPGSTDGIRWLHEIYAEAIAREYRFFSYGDAMLIL